MLHTVGTGQRDRSAAALVGPVRLHLASGPHGNHIIGNLRTAESCSRHRWNSGTWRPVCPAWMHLHGKPTYKRPHGDSLASSLPRRLPVPKDGHSCPPVYDPMFTLALAAADRDVDARARRPTAHDKNKAPHTSLCANPHDTDKSKSKRILRRRGRGNQDFKRQTSHYMYLLVKALGIGPPQCHPSRAITSSAGLPASPGAGPPCHVPQSANAIVPPAPRFPSFGVAILSGRAVGCRISKSDLAHRLLWHSKLVCLLLMLQPDDVPVALLSPPCQI